MERERKSQSIEMVWQEVGEGSEDRLRMCVEDPANSLGLICQSSSYLSGSSYVR